MDKKFVIQFIVLLVVIFVGLFSIFNPSLLGLSPIVPGGGVPGGNVGSQNVIYKQIFFTDRLGGTKASLIGEVADTAEKRTKGLSYRDNMEINQGMIFLFDSPSKVRFIMTGMRFPLDFVWVRGDEVVDLLENVQPDPAQTAAQASQFYSPVTEVDKVVEVNAGYIKQFNLRIGDKILIQDLQTQ